MNAPDIAVQIQREVTDELRDGIAQAKERIEAEAKWYAAECFAGLEEWPQMLPPARLERAVIDIQRALYRDPEQALLDVQLVLSELICEAGKVHAETCERNNK